MLTAREKDMIVLWTVMLAAQAGRKAPTCDELAVMLDTGDGGPSVATTVNIMHRLEKRGLIQIRRFQREREVMIVETGKWTAPARCRTPHWRARAA